MVVSRVKCKRDGETGYLKISQIYGRNDSAEVFNNLAKL